MDVFQRFSVDEVEKSSTPLFPENWNDAVSSRLGIRRGESEAFSKPRDGMSVIRPRGWSYRQNIQIDVNTHGLVSAIHIAYSDHYPLMITPDDIWLCIVQGFALHVNKNSEKLRKHFVEFEGKKGIFIRKDDFEKGSPDNPWPEVFSEFSSGIRKHVGEKIHDLLVPTFTTTGPTEKAAAEITLMDTFQKFFSYRLYTRCGIPEIQLKGTVEDWKQLRERALGLGQFELEWWTTKCLQPVLDEFVATSEGHINKEFWSSIYKISDGSGGPYISGWILNLFPYVNKYQATTDQLPAGISAAPFVWQYLNEEIKMKFFAGFVGVYQDPQSLCISCAIGWAVARQLKEDIGKDILDMLDI